ncbi:MAG: vitamin B12-dependent ribonucleotide reductase [Holophagales bacterium]|nr:vitamin B12-dependent ribonucleotide reductase [Holophagales bacterium]MYJ26949.1 vitamin B12-dependent ribonucleotide reductase [Holophagales bacterium]
MSVNGSGARDGGRGRVLEAAQAGGRQVVAAPAAAGAARPAETPGAAAEASSPAGLTIERRYSEAGVHPFDRVEWDVRDAVIANEKGETVFEQHGVEVPKAWSQTATNVVVSKYFRGQLGTPERESSARQLISRVADRIADWGREGGYFSTPADAESFHAELTHILLHQYACFNSPVWFNVGIEEHPQCSACFINSVEDTMQSILGLAKTEGMLFKFGSGTGSNLSSLRSSAETLAGGGTASGPVSFMRGFDAFAGVIKSGGKTRRAAKMVILDADHPDIVDFIRCKEVEERKAWALIEAGYDAGFNVAGGAYDSIFYQNANHSVRATDEFMQAVVEDGEWTTTAVTDGQPMDTHRAAELLDMIAESTWVCGDPGMQFDSTINHWHTCPNTDRINASNPCSEYMFLDDTACNLASLNLMRFYDPASGFDTASFRHTCEIVITAQEIIVDNASYPTPKIEENSHAYRPLGIGYANLGALLMARGLPYDSAAGRDYAGAVTALMSGASYLQSTRIAAIKGPFEGYEANSQPMLQVMRNHRAALKEVEPAHVPLELLNAAKKSWDGVVEEGERNGIRNSQISVLAPTGTIAFMMDCDTTGVEPDIALVKYKKLVGGGMIKIVNRTVPLALERLGYEKSEVQQIVEYIDDHDTIEGAPHLADEHLAVFDCAFKPANGSRSIHHMGHLRMLAAAQPFISGAISKTINMPEESTPEEIRDAYVEGWKLGLKAVAIYRDGCKRSQPLSTKKDDAAGDELQAEVAARAAAGITRRRLPDERHAITHKFSINGHEGFLTVGLYEDGQPGEIFLLMAKEGSTISGLMDSFAQAVSVALQYGVPLQILVDKFTHSRFEPSGFTKNPEIPMAKSVMDYIFRWLASKFLSREAQEVAGVIQRSEPRPEEAPAEAEKDGEASAGNGGHLAPVTFLLQQDAPSCHDCGSIMVRNGSCYKCMNCGSTSGCS